MVEPPDEVGHDDAVDFRVEHLEGRREGVVRSRAGAARSGLGVAEGRGGV